MRDEYSDICRKKLASLVEDVISEAPLGVEGGRQAGQNVIYIFPPLNTEESTLPTACCILKGCVCSGGGEGLLSASSNVLTLKCFIVLSSIEEEDPLGVVIP